MKKIFLRLVGTRRNYYRSYYDRIFTQYNDTSSYLLLYNKYTATSTIKTDVEICFSKALKFGCSVLEVKNKLHKPNYQIRQNESLCTEILLYRIFIGKHKVRCQMHFYKDRLFLYNYTFSYVNKFETKEIINVIKEKYVSDIGIHAEQNIIDKFNNCLQIEDDVRLTINYLSLNSDFFNEITLRSFQKGERRTRKNDAEFTDLYNRI